MAHDLAGVACWDTLWRSCENFISVTEQVEPWNMFLAAAPPHELLSSLVLPGLVMNWYALPHPPCPSLTPKVKPLKLLAEQFLSGILATLSETYITNRQVVFRATRT